ncbi:hypothetical protein M408DRAFT_152988 [Serendipita vermifera MAFF 305830]|uniref:Zinc finger PHD-type domain-containing protein n=1 Tax=Serendipita vermifera MAFF 305830 TaxID=933852 RepID=A0A0C2XWS9_SERVB|nr:hypothetical protein M408DRAFT_152988 [Serendipita vermifera MAFF 305830]
MAALLSSLSPSTKAQDIPEPFEPQVIETNNLDLLSAAASSATPEPVVPKEETPAGDLLLDTLPLENSSSTSSALTGKGKVTGKRKRELSPVGMMFDSNSQNGPRTRRRTENGVMAAKSSLIDLSDGGRPILSCDYCPLHWHMDCLDPPMTAIPSSERRWMCPNHIEHIFVSLNLGSFVCLFD